MAAIRVHEFMSLDGVIDARAWTFDYDYDRSSAAAIRSARNSRSASWTGRADS
jgi:hypothetical protein